MVGTLRRGGILILLGWQPAGFPAVVRPDRTLAGRSGPIMAGINAPGYRLPAGIRVIIREQAARSDSRS